MRGAAAATDGPAGVAGITDNLYSAYSQHELYGHLVMCKQNIHHLFQIPQL